MIGRKSGGLAAGVLVLAFAGVGVAFAGDTMKYVVAAIPVPQDTAPHALAGLVYKTEAWVSGVLTIRLAALPAQDAKDVTWVLQTTSTQSRLQRADVDIYLIDEQGTRVANAHQALVMVHADRADQKVKMKLPAGGWAAAREVRVEVRFKTM
jgi:hypothetical protein